MTYIEFFDQIDSENVCACLTYVPDRVIYIGNNAKLINKHIECYERVFADRGFEIEFIAKTVSRSNVDKVVELLTNLIETYDDCVFDITGGDEMYNLALGMVCEKYPEKNIQIHKFNLENNAIYDCDTDGVTVYKDVPFLSVEENVRIYGGDVLYGDVTSENTYKWDLNSDFLNDIKIIWGFCKGNVRLWNTIIGTLEAIEHTGEVFNETCTTKAQKSSVENYLTRHKAKYLITKGFIKYFTKKGLITFYDDSDAETVVISYKNSQVKKCLTKAGQALEMHMYITLKNLKYKNGTPVYNDVMNGVVIDWDGKFHDETVEDEYDTENEIDILLMHNVVPVFVSCKNGIVTADELYKLNTVAERFGGRYAKKVLLATSISKMGEKGQYLLQRAIDMGINVIDNIHEIDEKKLLSDFKNLWSFKEKNIYNKGE